MKKVLSERNNYDGAYLPTGCSYCLVPTIDDVFKTENLAARVESGLLHVYHNNSYHVGVLHQRGTKYKIENVSHDCVIVDVGVVAVERNYPVFALGDYRGGVSIMVTKDTLDDMLTCALLMQVNTSADLSDYSGEIYKMAISCGGSEGCLHFKLIGTSQICNATGNEVLSGYSGREYEV